MTIYTIGFSQKSAEEFFSLLGDNDVRILMDIRLNNRSQLAGFTKGRDLPFFLRRILRIPYRHETLLAPSKELLDGYKKGLIDWSEYVRIYEALLDERNIARRMNIDDFDGACLLCSEPTAERCHRRLAAEYLQRHFPEKEITIRHL